jgi:hypothetical protein
MKNLHENTVSLFVNPSMFIIMYIIMIGKNELGHSFEIYKTLLPLDWILMAFLGLASFTNQTLRYKAL